MPISLLGSTLAQPGQNGGTTPSVNTTGAALIVVLVASFSTGTVSSVSDSKGNTFLPLTPQTGSQTNARLYYCSNPTVGAGHTFTVSGSGIYPFIGVAAFGGVATVSAFDVQGGAPAVAPGTITTTATDLVVTGICGSTGSGAFSINSGYTVIAQAGFINGAAFGGALGYLIQTSAGATSPTWTSTASDNASVIGAFKPGAATGSLIRVGFEGGMNSKMHGGFVS